MKIKIVLIFTLSVMCLVNAKAEWKTVYDSGTFTTEVLVYADGENIIARNDFGIMLSMDNGKTWKQEDTSTNMQQVIKIIRKDSALFAGTIYGGIYSSIDSGKTWKKSGKWPFTNALKNIAISGNNIIAALDIDKVILSKDNGKTWDSSNTGLPPSKYGAAPYYSIRTFSGFSISGNNVLCFSDNNEYISYDHGLNWLIKLSNCPFIPLNVLFNMGQRIFAGPRFIFSSIDSGTSWQKVFSPKMTIGAVQGFCTNGKVIFAAVEKEGIIISKDSGQNWVYINDGLSSLDVASTAITKDFIYCGASRGKVFRRSLSDAVGIEDPPLSNEVLHLKVYPNPLKHSSTIEFGRKLKNGSYRLFDIAGKQVQGLSEIYTESITIYRNNLPPGVYIYYLLEDGKKLAMGKINIQS